MRNNNILKGVLLLRKSGNKYNTKEEQIAEVNKWFEKGYINDASLQEWIDALRYDIEHPETEEEQMKRIEQMIKAECKYASVENDYISCTSRDYGPSNPWDAPGMSISDFIR